MRASLQNVATLAGVGLSTASRALNQSGYVSEAVRKRVLDAARQLNYYPDSLAQQLATAKRKTIAFFDIGRGEINASYMGASAFLYPLIASAGNALAAEGYQLQVAMPQIDDRDYFSVLQRLTYSRSSAGIILSVRRKLEPQLLQALSQLEIPTVSLNCVMPEWNLPAIVMDLEAASFAATNHLIDQGHSRIVHISGPQDIQTMVARSKGYEKAMQQAGLQPQIIEGQLSGKSGYSIAMQLLTAALPPTGVFYANDHSALGAMRAASKLGLCIPKDLAIIGVDNMSFSQFVTPSLTTIAQPMEEAGKVTVSTLLKCLHGEPVKPLTTLDCPLIIRESSVIPQ